jgi:type III secretion protein Q
MRDEADARTLLARVVREVGISLGGTSWQLTLEPLAFDASRTFDEGDWVLQAQWAGAPFEIRMPATAADQMMAGCFDGLDLPDLPAPLRAAALEMAFADVMEALAVAGQGRARMDRLDIDLAIDVADHTSLPHAFSVALAGEAVVVWATLATNKLGLMAMAGLAADIAQPPGVVRPETLPVRLRAEIGAATLRAAQLRNLAIGDALIAQEVWIDAGKQLRMRAGAWAFRARLDGSRLVITEPFESMGDKMEDDFDNHELDERPIAVGDVPVRLLVDVGERMMTLEEVCGLQVGQVVELVRPLSRAVNIRANGALIGTGELVDLGDRLAVSITSLHAVPDARAPAHTELQPEEQSP